MEAGEVLLGCLATESPYGTGRAHACIDNIIRSMVFQTLSEENRGRIEYALDKLEEAQLLFDGSDREQALLSIQHVISAMEHVRTQLQE